jgi:hypothetical protein
MAEPAEPPSGGRRRPQPVNAGQMIPVRVEAPVRRLANFRR